MSWLDAHCHLSEVSKNYNIAETLKSADERGIKGWLSNALSKEEVRWHLLNKDNRIKFSAGIHPVYDAGTTLTLDELDILAKNKQIFAIGEIGLDKKNRKLDSQLKLLRDQISLARAYDLPCIFHMSGHLDEFYKILYDMPVRGIWHGFNASRETVKQFSKFDITYSIGQMLITSLKNEVINDIIKYGNFMIETDAPHNLKKPDKTADFNLNPLIELINYARIVSRMNGVKIDSLELTIAANSKQYFV